MWASCHSVGHGHCTEPSRSEAPHGAPSRAHARIEQFDLAMRQSYPRRECPVRPRKSHATPLERPPIFCADRCLEIRAAPMCAALAEQHARIQDAVGVQPFLGRFQHCGEEFGPLPVPAGPVHAPNRMVVGDGAAGVHYCGGGFVLDGSPLRHPTADCGLGEALRKMAQGEAQGTQHRFRVRP